MNLTPKVASGGISGAVSVVVIWILSSGFHIQIPPEIASAITVIISFLASYLAPRAEPTPDQVTKILKTNAIQNPNI